MSSGQPRRLAEGGRIDRSRGVPFRWDGRAYQGHPGDTLASALLAAGIRVFGRSFKYHRPRGLSSAGVEESGALVTLGSGARRDANVRATTQELYPGLEARGQNAWPSVRFDIGAVNNALGRFFAAGFYYKTFMGLPPFEWGRGTFFWMQYEKLIRRAAGMGRASREPDPDRYEHAHDFCDVLVVGSGPAGLAAAQAAAESGLDVRLVEQDFEPGGDYLDRPGGRDEELRRRLHALAAAGVRVMTRTTVFGLYDGGAAGLLERVTDHLAEPSARLPRQRFWVVRARFTVVAAGALERAIAFGDNDRPGIMTAAAARRYLNRFGVLAGERIVVATNNDSAYTVAADLARAGAEVSLLDARAEVDDALRRRLRRADVDHRPAHAPLRARGGRKLRGLDTALADGAGWREGERLGCDLLLVSGGWSPVVNLSSQRGVRPVWDAKLACFLPGQSGEPLLLAGAAAGVFDERACVASGHAAGLAAASALGRPVSVAAPGVSPGGWTTPIRPLYEVRTPGRKLKSFVDLQHDVTADDVRLARREGFVSVEHLKRYTTLGMATDQGKTGNVIGLALMAEALGKDIPEVGTTTFRPPYTPVSLGALSGPNVGAHFKPLRRTPLHDWNLAQGAVMTDAGLWRRPWYYPRPGETLADAYVREAAAVRRTVGLCDVTSLGKIAVQGPDATEFLNRVYANPFAKLAVGKARYGVMLRDDGLVLDDGTTWRLAEDDYLMTTTTAHAAKVLAWLEELLQLRWPELRVHVSSVSEQWAGVAVAGPRSRAVLAACAADPDAVADPALPFMGVAESELAGMTCRIARISFSGELAYEVYMPADYAPAAMDALWQAAQREQGCLYGLEALGALRIEKGHVTGAELDGRVTLDDAGLGRMASNKKAYIGSALRQRPELQRHDRPQLVGLFPKDRSQTFHAGAILCAAERVAGLGKGWVSAVTHSPALGHWIGLGFIAGGVEAWRGRDAVAADPVRRGKNHVEVEIVSPHMVDPEGERLRG